MSQTATAERTGHGNAAEHFDVLIVGAGISAIGSAVQDLAASNQLFGLVIDLRFADGDDYAAAADVVDLFLKVEVPLLNAGKGLVNSRDKTNALRMPVVALVNGETGEASTLFVPTPRAKVRSTVGAGDVLLAAFLHARASGSPVGDALKGAVGWAAAKVEQPGTTMPTAPSNCAATAVSANGRHCRPGLVSSVAAIVARRSR